MSFHVNQWRRRSHGAGPLLKKVNKVEVNIKICHITYVISHDFNLEDKCISKLYIEKSLKITILQI